MRREVPTWVVIVAVIVVLIITGLIYWLASRPPEGVSGPPMAPEHPAAKKGMPPGAMP